MENFSFSLEMGTEFQLIIKIANNFFSSKNIVWAVKFTTAQKLHFSICVSCMRVDIIADIFIWAELIQRSN